MGTPPGIEGADEAEKTARYARALAEAVEKALPTDYFVARVKETTLDRKDDLLKFFEFNPDFSIKDTRLEAFLKTKPNALDGLQDAVGTKNELKGLQRVYRLVSGVTPAIALYRDGKRSAAQISRMAENAFLQRHGPHFGDAETAKQAYAKARQVSAAVVALTADLNPADGPDATEAVPDTVAKEVRTFPNGPRCSAHWIPVRAGTARVFIVPPHIWWTF